MLTGKCKLVVASDESDPVSERRGSPDSGRAELTPRGESDGAVRLEPIPAAELAILVEVVEDRRMNRDEPLQGLAAAEAVALRVRVVATAGVSSRLDFCGEYLTRQLLENISGRGRQFWSAAP